MAKFKVKVTDLRKKCEPRVYEVEAKDQFLAYAEATNKFIADNGIKPYKPGTSMRAYFSRFWNEVVHG